jgi:hypothetical protein
VLDSKEVLALLVPNLVIRRKINWRCGELQKRTNAEKLQCSVVDRLLVQSAFLGDAALTKFWFRKPIFVWFRRAFWCKAPLTQNRANPFFVQGLQKSGLHKNSAYKGIFVQRHSYSFRTTFCEGSGLSRESFTKTYQGPIFSMW